MNVRFIAITKPYIDGIYSAEELIAYCARVSNPSNQMNIETAPRLLRYCIKHGHWSIFETVSMTVEVTTSRAIAAQMLRHRSFTFQEFSQRYAVSTEREEIEFRTQDTENRQGSGEVITSGEWPISEAMRAIGDAFMAYDNLIDAGVSRETARMVLPLCTQTTLYMTGNVRSWIHYFEQRCAEHTQKEHREVANAIRDIFNRQFPSVSEALKETQP